MATYNGARYIEEQLCSILRALDANDEIILSDDGSTDDTLARVEAMNDARITVLSGGPRLGYQANFARAIPLARGEYVFFSDQDDVCLPARLPRSLAALANAACVCGDAIVVDEHLSQIDPSYFAQRKARFSAAMLFLRPAVIGATLACRRSFLSANLPFPPAIPHDMWLSIQAARHGQLAVVHEPFILYRRHRAVVTGTGTARRRPFGARLAERMRLVVALLATTSRPGNHS